MATPELILWEDAPYDPAYDIQYVGPWGKHFNFNVGYMIDPKHPRCGYCGRFVKVKWDRSFTGPCTICYEDTRWL